MESRWALVAPDLVAPLDLLPEPSLRRVVEVVARHAVSVSGLEDAAVASALDHLSTGGAGLSAAARVREAAARLDDLAWDIQEADAGQESAQYVTAFRRARAASAVAFALDPDRSAALESLYESHAALGSVDAVRRLIAPMLSTAEDGAWPDLA